MFYKLLENGNISYGQFVQSQDYTLDHALKDTYNYPLPDGWLWFDTANAAEQYFGIQIN